MLRKYQILLVLIVCVQNAWAQRPKVAFVLSGGGARGFAHIGALKVLEEVGFKPDIITGTSMGSVVGGLYAIGYRSDSLEKIVKETDWDGVVYDRVSRNSLNAIERERYDRYFAKFQFEGIKFIQYSGLVKGTQIQNMLTRLCLPASEINDFKKLPIPFACVATDIQTGQKVVLNKGSLPQAIRASMAIPSLFTSIEIDKHILVDGGLTQNYPIQEARDMGADYIIGIDVGSKVSRDELNSFVNIMMESLFLHGYQNFDKEQKYLSIDIKPDVSGYSPLDFMDGDSIMKLGEAAARAHIDELKALYEKIYGKRNPVTIETNTEKLQQKVLVKEIQIEGLRTSGANQLSGILGKHLNTEMSSGEIDELINELNNTNLFDRITYQFDNIEQKGLLTVYVVERSRGEFDVGINYNNYHEASLLMGISYKGLLAKGTMLKADFRLSSTPRVDLSYYYQSRLRPAFGIEGSLNNIEQGFYVNHQRASTIYNSYLSVYLKAKYNISNQRNVGVGLGLDQCNNETDALLSLDEVVRFSNTAKSSAVMIFYRQDSRDDTYIPTKGGRTMIDAYWVGNELNIGERWFSGMIRLERHNRVAHRVHISNYLDIGLNDAGVKRVNTQFLFTTGGMLDMRYRYYLPFAGLNFGEVIESNIVHYRIKPTWRLFKGNYVSVLTDVGMFEPYVEDLLMFQDIVYAVGASYEYRSPIGPIQFNVSRSNVQNEFSFFLNIGYWF